MTLAKLTSFTALKTTAAFLGSSAATDAQIEEVKQLFPEYIFPADYIAFMQIHNGFWKTTDCTGMIKIENIPYAYHKFQELFSSSTEPLRTSKGVAVDAKKLIPFYESFGMPFYQCFWAEWYPEEEMGNVYYSGNTSTISEVPEGEPGPDSLRFQPFSIG